MISLINKQNEKFDERRYIYGTMTGYFFKDMEYSTFNLIRGRAMFRAKSSPNYDFKQWVYRNDSIYYKERYR